MKRIFMAVVLACFTLAISAQIKVNYQGAKLNITDLAWALVTYTSEDSDGENEAINVMRDALSRYRKGVAQPAGETLIVDQANGYIRYERKDGTHLLVNEMCYWNEADKKHKLFAHNVACYSNGKNDPGQYDGITFYRYTNATKRLDLYYGDLFYNLYASDVDAWNTFSLPRTGKDIVVTTWYQDGRKKQKTAKWTGTCFDM